MTDSINIIGKKWWFIIFSGVIILPGIISLILWGLRLSIDFTGGSLIELKFQTDPANNQNIEEVIKNRNLDLVTVSKTRENSYLLRLKPIDKNQNILLQQDLNNKLGKVEELRFERSE